MDIQIKHYDVSLFKEMEFYCQQYELQEKGICSTESSTYTYIAKKKECFPFNQQLCIKTINS